jgi:hypothetical protein
VPTIRSQAVPKRYGQVAENSGTVVCGWLLLAIAGMHTVLLIHSLWSELAEHYLYYRSIYDCLIACLQGCWLFSALSE